MKSGPGKIGMATGCTWFLILDASRSGKHADTLATINADTPLLPPPTHHRRYDDLKSAQDNIDLQSTILSRFDLIFIVKDPASEERDAMIARKVGLRQG